MNSIKVFAFCLFVIGFWYVTEAYSDFNNAYRDYSLNLDNYEIENLIRPIMSDDESDEDNEEDEEDENDGDNYDNYDDENADKRDIIKGPSYVPNIDDDSAENYLDQENYETDFSRKRKTIPKKSTLPSSDDPMDKDKPVANENDVADTNIAKETAEASSPSVPEVGKATVTTKKSKGKINVMVNVNINERPARRSKVNHAVEFPRSTYKKELDSSKGIMQQYGALQKLREDSENSETSGSGSSDDNQQNLKPVENNTTLNLFAGIAFPKHDHIQIVNVVNGSDTDTDDNDNDDSNDSDDNNASGSGESQGDDVSTKAEKYKAHSMKPQTASVQKAPGVVVKRPVRPLTQKMNFHKKYHPTHAYEEAAEAEKGETPDTVFASKIAADKEEKDNEMEHNDEHAENVDLVKHKQEKELSKAVEDEVSTDQKSKSTGVSKTLDSETEELAHSVTSEKLKTTKVDAEDVSIEQLKDKDEKPKDIPKDSAMEEKTPEVPLEKVSAIEKDEDKVASSKATKDVSTGDEKVAAVKTPSSEKEDGQNDEILFTKKEREHKFADNDGKESIGKNNQDDKYETLEEVREKFKTWENRIEKDNDSLSETVGEKEKKIDVKSDKKSENVNKESSEKHTASGKSKNGTVPEEKAKTWKEEEKLLLEKLKNPFLHESLKFKNDEEEDQEEENQKEQQVEKVASDITKSANAEFTSVVDKVTSSVAKTDKQKKQEKDTKELQESADKAFSSVVNKVTSGQEMSVPEVEIGGKDKEQSPKIENVKFKEMNNNTLHGNKNLMQLQKFKEQILSEVSKIDNLQGEYGKDGRSATELKEAKDVLEKDLNVVKDLENNLKKKAFHKSGTKSHKKGKSKHQKHIKTNKHSVAAATFAKPVDPAKDQEIIPDAKLGFDENPQQKKHKSKLDKMKKALNSYEYSYYVSKKESDKNKKSHPLEEITTLLKAEIQRLKKKGNKPDKQLNLIRGLVQQKIKAVIANGDLDKEAFHSLGPEIKELGKLLKSRINKEKKRKKWHKKKTKKIKGGHMSSKNIDMMKQPVRNPLDSFEKGNKMLSPGPQSGIDKQINKMQSELSKVNKSPPSNSNQNQQQSSPNNLQQATQHLSNAQTAFQNIESRNVSLDPKQSSNIKTLLTTLNKNLGEIYNKAQGVQQQNQPPQQQQQQQQQPQQYGTPNATTYPSMQTGVDPNAQLQDIYIPATFTNTAAQTQNYNHILPQDASHQTAEGKHDTPTPAEDIDIEESKGKALADDEPVDTLVEELERDITDVWSYRDMFPDADSLGLDNEKVHNTYANLGSLSGLNLRRALNRALRGEDVGLAVVGGSISKGGPFSEKGLDFVLRSYFYAIEDYWNKIIRPVTGSSMIIRDVSIGGIATDYYSYCLQNHLPDDKLTNIVLWELSANDLRRYEGDSKPKPQPLEQFTRNVLSYKAKPALIYINFFALFDWEPDLAANCRNYEDEGEDEVAKYYKITSLSWRNMACPLLKAGNQPLFTKSNLFAEDNFHPSILAHAQMSYITIDYIRTEFLKNLVKMRRTFIADAVARLQIPKSIYIPRSMYAQTYSWKPHCFTYMLVDNRSPNNTLEVDEEVNGNFRYTVVREFKIRSDKIVGMETQNKDQFIRFRANVPKHAGGGIEPYRRMGIMTFTDDRYAQVQFDSEKPLDINSKKKFLEGTVIKTIAENVKPGEHTITVRSGSNGFLICALVLG